MTRVVVRAAVAAGLSAILTVAWLVASFGRQTVSFDLYRDTPPGVSGAYAVERNGPRAFLWTSGRADFRLPGLDRHVSWSCTTRLSGGRPDATPQPDVTMLVDGVALATLRATNAPQTIIVSIPRLPSGRGLVLSIVSAPTFNPGPADPRELGAQLDLLECQPASRATMPLGTALGAAGTAAILGAAIGLAGTGVVVALLAIVVVACGLAFVFVTGLAAYGAYPASVVWLAAWIGGVSVSGRKLLEARTRKPWPAGAGTALVATMIVLFFTLAGLLHPSKTLIDAVFHAHRFEGVLAGHYFFTQPLGSGVNFPYAIGLYVFAAPWSLLTRDHVALLRVVVCAMNAIAGLLAYRMVVQAWADERAGAIAAVLFGLTPGWFGVLGNANLTNAFGQSVAVIALAGVVLLKLDWKSVWPLAALTAVVALAFLSHVSTVALLSATMVMAAGLFWWRGGSAMRTPALVVLGVTLVAGALSVAVYYGRSEFMPSYKALALVRAPLGQHTSPISARAAGGARLFVDSIGWPAIILAVIGAWRLWSERSRDRLAFVIAASMATAVLFSMQNILTRVDTHLERYAAEFLARIDGATAPALVMLAARGASWSWGAGRAGRVLSIALIIAACIVGARAWLAWL